MPTCIYTGNHPARQPDGKTHFRTGGDAMIVDTKQRYGLVSRLFHWGVALLVLWQVMKIFDRINDGEHWVGQNLVPWHVSIGSLLLVLIVLRIVWALGQHNN